MDLGVNPMPLRTLAFGVVAFALAFIALFRVYQAIDSQQAAWGPARDNIRARRLENPRSYWAIVAAHFMGAMFFLWIAYVLIHSAMNRLG